METNPIEKPKRVSEKTPEEALLLARYDFERNPKEFLGEIYKEAYNAEQDPDARISKTIGKFSVMFARLSTDQSRMAERLEKLTWGLLLLTVALLVFTAYLCYDAHENREGPQFQNESSFKQPNFAGGK